MAKIRYAGFNPNDMVNGEGVCVSLFLQGCPHHCKGCHNPETWDPNGGIEIEENALIAMIDNAIAANGITRNLSLSGGEPLSDWNLDLTKKILYHMKQSFPTSKITIWTGYKYAELLQDLKFGFILSVVDMIITGPFILAERDVSLPLRGSRNQQIWKRDYSTGQLTLIEK